MKAHGEERFTDHGKDLGFNVIDFWRFTYNDLLSDPRDEIAEYLVAKALGKAYSTNRENWTLYDIEYAGKRVEVKCTGYYQTWRTDGEVCQNRTFSIKKTHTPETGELARQNDVYVFCLLLGNTREEADPTKLEHWEFYVVPTELINDSCGDNQRISLNRIKKLGIESTQYAQLKERIDAALKVTTISD